MAKITLDQIRQEIMFGGHSLEEISTIVEAVKFARSNLGKQVKNSLTIGSKVEFTDGRNGMKYSGTVLKVAIKNVTVKTVQGPTYRVPASMLSVV